MQTLSRFITTHVKLIITVWIIIFITFAFLAIQLPQKLEGDGFTVDGDHNRVLNELSETFDLPEKSIIVLFEDKTNTKIEKYSLT